MRTLKQRLTFVQATAILLCFALVAAVSYVTIKAAENNHIQSAMQVDLAQLMRQADEDYYALVQMSQQMVVTGNIGKLVNDYFSSDSPYDRIRASLDATTNINIMVFSHNRISMIGYYTLNADGTPGGTLLATLPVRSGIDPREYPDIMRTDQLELQAPHRCMNRISDRDVVSLTRAVTFGGADCFIYAEMFQDMDGLVSELADTRALPYRLIQLDEGGVIKYSSHSAFVEGETLALPRFEPGVTGALDEYAYLAAESKFGFLNVLMIESATYQRQLLLWKLGVGSVFLVALALVFLTGTLLVRLIYRPLHALTGDIEDAGRGNLVPVERSFGIEEFDKLFKRFEEMKRQIAELMENAREQERENKLLELDKLYYQINPHFLMNALNSAHWLAVVNDQPEIDRYINQLNYILSYSLGKTDQSATLRTELKSLEIYLALQQQRYNFDVHMDVEDGGYLDSPSARLILQPLAENAVCHNMSDFGNLWVSIRRAGTTALVTMRDDGPGFEVPQSEAADGQLSKGIGLNYVRMCLKSYYGDDAQLIVDSEPGQGTTATLNLPLIREGESDVPRADN